MISSAIEAGDIEVGIAGGVEDMFTIPQEDLPQTLMLNWQNKIITYLWAKVQNYLLMS